MPGLAAVTGATGFLGRRLVRELAGQGWRPRVLARREGAEALWPDLDVEVVRGDLADASGLQALCAGADAVFHLAGVVKAPNRATFWSANVAGAEAVARAAAGRVILISSLAAREPHLSAYAGSKRAGETVMAAVLGPALTILRPPAIYGPEDREMLPVFQAAARAPILPRLTHPARIAMIHVDDAARQIVAAAAAKGGEMHALSDSRPDGYTWTELLQSACEAVGRRPRLIATPSAALKLAGLGGDLAAALGASPMLTSGKARELLHGDWSIAPSEQPFALPPAAFDLGGGFAHTAAAYRASGWL